MHGAFWTPHTFRRGIVALALLLPSFCLGWQISSSVNRRPLTQQAEEPVHRFGIVVAREIRLKDREGRVTITLTPDDGRPAIRLIAPGLDAAGPTVAMLQANRAVGRNDALLYLTAGPGSEPVKIESKPRPDARQP